MVILQQRQKVQLGFHNQVEYTGSEYMWILLKLIDMMSDFLLNYATYLGMKTVR